MLGLGTNSPLPPWAPTSKCSLGDRPHNQIRTASVAREQVLGTHHLRLRE